MNSLIGKQFGNLTVIEFDSTDYTGEKYWKCRCNRCGRESIVYEPALLEGKKIDCGYHNTIIDLSGFKTGRITVIKPSDCKSPRGKSKKWVCKCDCGNPNLFEVSAYNLLKGETKSCGCLRLETSKIYNTTVRQENLRLYDIWIAMKRRCYVSTTINYKDYGGRGITVCDEWLVSYENFYYWAINNGYNDNLSIDRIDVNGNYEPKNCRWADSIEQGNNKRNLKLYEINGEKKTITQWSRIYGVPQRRVYARVHKYNWDIIDALTIPPLPPGQKYQK